jgi:hypothetical protein
MLRLQTMRTLLLTLLAGLCGAGCSPRPCQQWQSWEFPRLNKIEFCMQGMIQLTLDDTPEALWAIFEKRGYERGSADENLILGTDAVFFSKPKTDEMFKVARVGDQFTITTASQTGQFGSNRFLSLADAARIDAFPSKLSAWNQKNNDLPALFDRSPRAGRACDAAQVREGLKPLLAEQDVPFLLNIDSFASGQHELRVGVPPWLKAHEKTAPSLLRTASREFDELTRRDVVVAFRVTKYVEPAFIRSSQQADGSTVSFYSPGVVGLDLALLDLSKRRVVCRRALTALSEQGGVNRDSNFSLDLARVVALKSQAAFQAP